MSIMYHSILQEICAYYRLDYLTAEPPLPDILDVPPNLTTERDSHGREERFYPIYCRWAFQGQRYAVALTPILKTVIYKPRRWLVFPMTEPGSHHHEYDDAAMLEDLCAHIETSLPSSAFYSETNVKPLDNKFGV